MPAVCPSAGRDSRRHYLGFRSLMWAKNFAHINDRLHARWASIPYGKVGPSCARSVISDAHPPGDPLLPFQGNSPCVAGNDEVIFYSIARGRWNSLQEGFYLQWNKTNFFSLHFVET